MLYASEPVIVTPDKFDGLVWVTLPVIVMLDKPAPVTVTPALVRLLNLVPPDNTAPEAITIDIAVVSAVPTAVIGCTPFFNFA